MSNGSFLTTTLDQVVSWAQANSLWYLSVASGCCADEMLNVLGCRYDVERFGCLPQAEPKQADLLIISGAVTLQMRPHLKAAYESMLFPKSVMAVGACACSGGIFPPEVSYSVVFGVDEILPVDVYVPGCPPRPEAIMNGILKLQEKIHAKK